MGASLTQSFSQNPCRSLSRSQLKRPFFSRPLLAASGDFSTISVAVCEVLKRETGRKRRAMENQEARVEKGLRASFEIGPQTRRHQAAPDGSVRLLLKAC